MTGGVIRHPVSERGATDQNNAGGAFRRVCCGVKNGVGSALGPLISVNQDRGLAGQEGGFAARLRWGSLSFLERSGAATDAFDVPDFEGVPFGSWIRDGGGACPMHLV